jgi:excinuclease ABC subunit A
MRRAGSAHDRDELSADVKVLCEQCEGRRFDPETLEGPLARAFGGRRAGDERRGRPQFFQAHPRVRRPLALLRDVGWDI